MEVEQRVDAGLGDGADVAQHVLGLGVVALRLEIEIEPLQTVGDRPAEQRAIALARCATARSVSSWRKRLSSVVSMTTIGAPESSTSSRS